MDKWCEQNITEDPLSLEIEKVLREMQEHEDADIFNRFKSELRNVIPALPNIYIFELITILSGEVLRRSCANTEIEFKPDVSQTTNYKYGLEGYCISDTVEDQIT